MIMHGLCPPPLGNPHHEAPAHRQAASQLIDVPHRQAAAKSHHKLAEVGCPDNTVDRDLVGTNGAKMGNGVRPTIIQSPNNSELTGWVYRIHRWRASSCSW